MLPVHFCNYNLDYQQRLGFLKLVAWAGQSVRGGKEDLVRRVEALYGTSMGRSKKSRQTGSTSHTKQASPAPVRLKGSFDPEVLLQRDEVPSWQSGFSFQRLDRLVLWAEMLGLVTPTGRLAEWSKPLIVDAPPLNQYAGDFPNPFLLSRRECSYFLAVLMYHDHVLLHLTSTLAQLEPGTRVEPRRACVQTTDALCRTLDCAAGTNIHAARTRQSLRDLLERLAGMEHLANKHALFNPTEREGAIEQMAVKSMRNHLAEYHAICRFEQLTDLGLLVKDDPSKPSVTREERYRTRTSWAWYTTEGLRSFGPYVQNVGCDIESYLQNHWAKSSSFGRTDLRELDARRDQREIAKLLDRALPRARRQLGPIQVHTWVFIAALDAIDQGLALEFAQAYALLDAMRQDSRYSDYLRQSGQQTYLGRTASLIGGTMLDYVSRYPITT
jgi:hypothetical protein